MYKRQGLPCLIDLGTPCYNLDLLAEIGMTEEDLPTTWDEYDAMLAACLLYTSR